MCITQHLNLGALLQVYELLTKFLHHFNFELINTTKKIIFILTDDSNLNIHFKFRLNRSKQNNLL